MRSLSCPDGQNIGEWPEFLELTLAGLPVAEGIAGS